MSDYDRENWTQSMLVERCEQLEAENDKLRKYRDVMETAHGKRLYEMEMLREHFDDAGELRGDGKWRLRQIAEALKNLDEGSQRASQLFDGEYENRLKQLEAENAKLRMAIDTMLLAFDYDGSRQVGAIFDAKENLKAVIRKAVGDD